MRDRADHHTECKYIIPESKILELASRIPCTECGNRQEVAIHKVLGTALVVRLKCSDCHSLELWKNQPFLGNPPVLNLVLSAAILFTGNLPTKSLRILSYMNVATINRSTFFRHQQQYLQPTVEKLWKDEQGSILHTLKTTGADGKLICAGDGRSDSPGHCAKYGSYTLLEQTVNKVLDVQVVQVRKLGNIYTNTSVQCAVIHNSYDPCM